MPSLRDAIPVVSGRPADFPAGLDRFEALIAFTAPGRGDRTASALDEAGLLEPEALATSSTEEVVDALRDARIEADPKAVRLLQRIAGWFRAHRDDLEAEPAPGEDPPPFPGDELSAINGVGRSTADSIALHVFGRATYPVDRATYRILVRHGWLDTTADYDEASQLVVTSADGDASTLAGASTGFTDLGRRFCKASGPRCEPCPLLTLLPDGGPIEAEG